MRRHPLLATAAVWVVGLGALRLSLLAPEQCPTISKEDAVAAATAAADWLAAGQQADGRYLYEYDRAAGRAAEGYNLVRHAGVTMSLYQLATAGADERVGRRRRRVGVHAPPSAPRRRRTGARRARRVERFGRSVAR